MENTEPPLKVVPLPHHPKCVTEHQGRVDKPGTSTWLGNWPSQLYIWRRTCEQYRKPENPIWVILYSGMILPLFWGFIARIKIYFRNHSWISWDFTGLQMVTIHNIWRILSRVLSALLMWIVAVHRPSQKKAAVSDLQIFIYYHLLVPSSTPIWSQWGWIKTYQHPFVHLRFCIFAGNVHKNH